MNITWEMKIQMRRMLLDGKTIHEIAEQFGYSCNEALLALADTARITSLGRNNKGPVYPAIDGWLFVYGYSQNSFAKQIGVSNEYFSKILRGKSWPTKPVIDKILRATGMTYEEAFGDPRKEHD